MADYGIYRGGGSDYSDPNQKMFPRQPAIPPTHDDRFKGCLPPEYCWAPDAIFCGRLYSVRRRLNTKLDVAFRQFLECQAEAGTPVTVGDVLWLDPVPHKMIYMGSSWEVHSTSDQGIEFELDYVNAAGDVVYGPVGPIVLDECNWGTNGAWEHIPVPYDDYMAPRLTVTAAPDGGIWGDKCKKEDWGIEVSHIFVDPCYRPLEGCESDCPCGR